VAQDITDIDLAEMRARLLALRKELESLAATGDQAAEVVELDQTRVGRLSRMDALQAQAMSKASGQRRNATLRNIELALKRIENGEYGLCIVCDESINPKRLEFDPAASLCIQCAEKAES
jgi:DnaK suppressor protein